MTVGFLNKMFIERNAMTNKKSQLIEEALAHPEQVYSQPADVVKDGRLLKEDKMRILENWELDEEALCRAEGENMPKKTRCEPPADELLRKIHNAKQTLMMPVPPIKEDLRPPR